MTNRTTDGRKIAMVRSYDELIAALRARSDELQVTRETLDHITGLQNGYSAKLLASVPVRMLGRISFGPMLQALGLVLVAYEDLSAIKKIDSRTAKRLKPRFDASGAMPTRKSKKRRGVFAATASGENLWPHAVWPSKLLGSVASRRVMPRASDGVAGAAQGMRTVR